MLRLLVTLLPVLLVFSCIGVEAQVVRFPTPTPTPRPTPSPSPTPERKPGPCPNVTIQSQGQPVRDGKPVALAANIAGGDPSIQPTIVWSVSAGVITQGQYTKRIEIDSTGAGSTPDREIKVDLWVGGYAPECLLEATTKVKVIRSAVKFGEFGDLPDEAVATNLKTLAAYMTDLPDNLYVIGYAGRNSQRAYLATWLRRLKEDLGVYGVAAKRIMAVDGGYREEPMFEFWIVPAGAELPTPTPTIARHEIENPKPAVPKKPGAS